MISRKPFADRNEIAVSLKVRRVSKKWVAKIFHKLLIELACAINCLVVLYCEWMR